MDIGIFAKTFRRDNPGSVLEAVASYGLQVTQFNMSCAGVRSMPERIPRELAIHIREAAKKNGVDIAAVSGTFNMIHPEIEVREVGLQRLQILAGACDLLGTGIITLCTGTRHPIDKWRYHPDNDSTDAWRDLCTTLGRALDITSAYDVKLAFEPEIANVVSSATKARRLITEMKSDRLGVIFDPANLFEVATASERTRLVAEGLDMLGDNLLLAHAKDRDKSGRFCAAGQGVLEYDHYLGTLQAIGFSGPLILHGLREEEVPGCVRFLQEHLT